MREFMMTAAALTAFGAMMAVPKLKVSMEGRRGTEISASSITVFQG